MATTTRRTATALLLLASGCAGGCFGGPMYEPGDVARRAADGAALEPPPQAPGEADLWQVEPGVKLFHFAQGAGRTALVLHGGPGLPGDTPWPGLAAVEGVAFHHFHARGSGRSTRPFDAFRDGSFFSNLKTLERTLGLGAQIADVERVRRLLGAERLVLVGHSFGALVAALYAAEFPERVAALVLESPADLLVIPSESGGLFEQVKTRLRPEQRADFDAYLERYLDFRHLFDRSEAELAALHVELGRFYGAAVVAGGGAAPPAAAAGQAGGFMPQAVYVSMGRKHDWRAALARVRAPTLVLHGERDLQPLAATRAFAAALPDAELRVIPGAGHFAHAEQAEAFASEVRAFLARVR